MWLDRNIVKAFISGGQIVHICKIQINDDLSISIHKRQAHSDLAFMAWTDLIDENKEHLAKLEEESVSLIKSFCSSSDRMIVDTSSTGKDSEVKSFLAQKAGLQFNTYFNVTTLDVCESNTMAKQKGYTFTFPNKKYGGFYQYVKRENVIPSRLNRFCCQYFKELATVEYFDAQQKIMFLFGMRNSESNSRSQYGDTWVNDKWGNRDWIGLLPIRKWSDLDIWLYILQNDIDINLKYKYGYSRVGCGIACPNYTKSTWVLDEYWYPIMFKRWRDILHNDFVKNNKWLIMNCTLKEYVEKAWTGGVYRKEPTNEVIEEYATYNNLDYDIATKYFNRHCSSGCLNKRKMPLKIKDKDTLAMNMKLFGRNISKFKCKKCLMKEFGFTNETWRDQIEKFKNQGCDLF